MCALTPHFCFVHQQREERSPTPRVINFADDKDLLSHLRAQTQDHGQTPKASTDGTSHAGITQNSSHTPTMAERTDRCDIKDATVESVVTLVVVKTIKLLDKQEHHYSFL